MALFAFGGPDFEPFEVSADDKVEAFGYANGIVRDRGVDYSFAWFDVGHGHANAFVLREYAVFD